MLRQETAFSLTMGSRWRVIEAVALPMLTLLFLGLWQGYRHHTDAIRALRLQLHELEQQQTEVNTNNLMEEQLEFLQRRQESLETQIGDMRRAQQRWRTQERQRIQRTEPEPTTRPSLDLIPIP